MAKVLSFIDDSAEVIGKTFSWMCLLMIFILLYEVFSRYVFNRPTEWAHESTTMLYGSFCLIGAVWTLREKKHVRTEVIFQMMPAKIQHFCDVMTGVVTLAMLAVFFYASFVFAAESWKVMEISAKSTWGVAVYPFKTVIPVAVFLMFFQQLAHTIRDAITLFRSADKHRTS